MPIVSIESPKGLLDEATRFLQNNEGWVNGILAFLAVCFGLSMLAPFLRGLAALITAWQRNKERNIPLQKAAEKHLKETGVENRKSAVHFQKLKRPQRNNSNPERRR